MTRKSLSLPQPVARLGALASLVLVQAFEGSAEPVDYARDVQPIFAKRCYPCHGPDKHKSGLRLDNRRDAFTPAESGHSAIIPGNSVESRLIRRILSSDEDDRMPPKGERVSGHEVETLERWIDEGATWPVDEPASAHWAYEKPVRPVVPGIADWHIRVLRLAKSDAPRAREIQAQESAWSAWPRNPVDNFVLTRLLSEGLVPSPATPLDRLCRRLHLDLVGLPPTIVEQDAFLSAARRDPHSAIDTLVDRLLASPQYGERWARPWLDLARYADSNGYQRDGFRDLWAYRDWVIRALNADMPFDRFTIEQLAGDLLPNATVEQRVATGFNLCTTVNVEAGADLVENRTNQVIDRVNTTGTVWLGSTLECAQCHDHKYDPFTQRDYYRFLAFFNNTEIETKLKSASATTAVDFAGPVMALPDPAIDAQRRALQARADELEDQIAALEPKIGAAAGLASPAGGEHVLDIDSFESAAGATGQVLADKSVLVGGKNPDVDTYTIRARTKLTGITAIRLEVLIDDSLPAPGPGRGGAGFVLNELDLEDAPESDPDNGRVVEFFGARADLSQRRWDVAGAVDDDPESGWALATGLNEPHEALFVPLEPLGSEGGSILTFTLEQHGGESRTLARLRLTALTWNAAAILAGSDAPERRRLRTERDGVLAAIRALPDPQTLVMRELPEARPTHVFHRGNFLDQGERVSPGVPGFLHRLPDGPPNRLTLARWLASPENPLVARAAVNRWWAEFFGNGLVATPEDYGVKGAPPTHPELLDWLASEFMERGWSMKHVHKLIATSATYLQDARMTPELLARDDRNELLARGPRLRLDAEAIRDNALAAAGLLSLKQGGPPVRPYQPKGIWNVVGLVDNRYQISEGEERYRRGIYVVWRRSAPYPSFMNFDASIRSTCVVRRSRSNTPLQALTLLNDPVHVEAALALARRILTELPDADAITRIRYAFRLCVARPPSDHEVTVLVRLLDERRRRYGADPASARSVIGAFAAPQIVDEAEFAAWSAVATALLNTDEMITKG